MLHLMRCQCNTAKIKSFQELRLNFLVLCLERWAKTTLFKMSTAFSHSWKQNNHLLALDSIEIFTKIKLVLQASFNQNKTQFNVKKSLKILWISISKQKLKKSSQFRKKFHIQLSTLSWKLNSKHWTNNAQVSE